MDNIKEKLVELIAKAKRSMWGKSGLSCELARNMYLAEQLIANGVTIQEWIPVEERLPESEGFYLTCRKKEVMVTWYGSGSLWKYIWDHDVDFWMPLPEVPK